MIGEFLLIIGEMNGVNGRAVSSSNTVAVFFQNEQWLTGFFSVQGCVRTLHSLELPNSALSNPSDYSVGGTFYWLSNIDPFFNDDGR